MPRPCAQSIAARVVPRCRGSCGRYAQPLVPGDGRGRRRRCSSTTSRRSGWPRSSELLAPALRAAARATGAYGASLGYFNAPNGNSTLLDRLLYADIKTYLVELLMKQDQMSMATSIESRVPFLDHKLVEFAATLPDAWKLSGFTTKRILREAVQGLLPESILTRPKMGFPVPFAGWMRGGWNGVARDVLLDRRSRERGIDRSGRGRAAARGHAAAPRRGRRRHLEPDEPRALAPHVHRRRRRPDAARADLPRPPRPRCGDRLRAAKLRECAFSG